MRLRDWLIVIALCLAYVGCSKLVGPMSGCGGGRDPVCEQAHDADADTDS
jgi:hypothetical protein